MNKVFLIGHLGKDVELKSTPTGLSIAEFSLATTEKFKKDGVSQSKTEWHKVKVFGKNGENCNKYISKGSHVLVVGKVTYRQWENDKNEKKYSTEIIADEITFLDAKSKSESTPIQDEVAKITQSFTQEEIPF